MENLEERINEVLADPVQMQKIMSIAQTLGAPPMPMPAQAEQPAENGGESSDPPEAQSEQKTIGPDAAAILRQASKMDQKQENLLNALRPFLRPARRQKFDRALQIARLSHLAGFALKTRTDQGENER